MNGAIEFYSAPPADYRKELRPGAICRAPIPFLLTDSPNRIVLTAHDVANPLDSWYTLESTDLENFDPARDKPLRHLRMNQDQFLLAVPSKLRPCILLSDPLVAPDSQDVGFSVVPLYSVRDAAGNYRPQYTFETVLKAQAYQIPNLFYLPEDADFSMHETVARLERIQFVREPHLLPRPAVLTDRALDLLRQWTANYFGMDVCLSGALQQYMEVAAKELRTRLGGTQNVGGLSAVS